jgi:hypothetical protein
MEKIQIRDQGFRMENMDLISESLETIFLVNILKFFDVDLGSWMEKFGSKMENNRIRDPR